MSDDYPGAPLWVKAAGIAALLAVLLLLVLVLARGHEPRSHGLGLRGSRDVGPGAALVVPHRAELDARRAVGPIAWRERRA